jgi:citrate lyase subunit beta/citryl-CoA lyase
MRSLLFVPGDSPRKVDKALGCGADALILDLEDSVAPDAKESARAMVSEGIERARAADSTPLLFVRVNALDTGLTDADLDGVMPAAPDAIVLPKATSGMDVQHLAAKLAVREAENALPDGSTRVMVIATESAAALFGMGSYRGASHRLTALTWGAEDLSADLGAAETRDAAGDWLDSFRLARAMALAAAVAADAAPIDTVYAAFRNREGFERECLAARRDGFTGKMAIHPDQVPVINAIFSPSDAEVERARRIVGLFAENPGAGVLSLEGEMLDRPHLRRAQRVLARAKTL